MIFSSLAQAFRYTTLQPLFPRAFAYLRDTDLNALAPGVHQIIDKQLFIIVEEANGRTRGEAKLEAHRRYIDIQLVLDGVDEMGWKALADCHQPLDEHNLEWDIRFFDDEPATWITVPPQHFCIFFPEDAHAPLVGKGAIRKVIMKIAVDAA
jgi:YhcH/YjgK/YiaL family protein